MRTVKLVSALILCLGLVGCSCSKRRVGPEENIALAEMGKELKDVNFAFDSFSLDGAAKGALDLNSKWLKDHSSTKFQVEGHCDERGTNEYNMALGAKRARAVADYLRAQGIEESRMGTVSYGEELPLDPRHDESAWFKNRRAHFNLTAR